MIVIKLEKADISGEQAKAQVLLSDIRDLVTNQLIQPVLFAQTVELLSGLQVCSSLKRPFEPTEKIVA